MRDHRTAKPSLWTAAILTGLLLAACGSSSGSSSSSTNAADTTTASASASANASASATSAAALPATSGAPAAAAVAPAASAGGVTLRIGDQAGTGAETLLEASGLISKLPFKVTWSDFTSGPPMLQALAAGDLDIGGVGDAPPVFAAAGHANLAIVGALATGANNAAVVVPANSPIHSISQLKGKKIAVAQGSSADYHLLTVLEKAGLTPKDVTLDYLQPADGLAALQSGDVDAWDIWSPFIEEATIRDGDRILVNGSGYGSPYSYEVASKAALASPKLVAAIGDYLKLLNRAHVWANTHPDAWGAVWAKATGLTPAIMDRAAADDKLTPAPVTGTIVSAEQGLVDAFFKAGLIPRSYDFSPYASSAFANDL
jgi:sulfonate transport system substrate-binding protein